MVGVAVKVTEVPAQIVAADEAMLIEGISDDETVIAIAFDVAVAGDAHVAFDVITTLTISPFAKDVVEYVEEFVPTLTPFNCH